MLYLEDYIELIEHLPSDLRERFTDMREMDLQVQNSVDSLDDKVKKLFQKCFMKKTKITGADQVYEEIRNEYYKALEDADEKVQLANQIYDLVDRHLRKLDQELSKFKMELEADNAGITEVLEQRSLELDNPQSQQRTSLQKERRKHAVGGTPHTSTSNTVTINNGDGPPEKKIKSEQILKSELLAHLQDNSNLEYTTKVLNEVAEIGGREVAGFPIHYHEGWCGLFTAEIPGGSRRQIENEMKENQSSAQPTRRTSLVKHEIKIESRTSEYDRISVDSLDANEQVSDSSICSATGGAVHRPFRAKKQTSKAAAWVQQRQQAEARLEQRKKETATVTDSNDPGVEVIGESSNVEWNFDPNEPRYCLCNQVSYGEMVGCDNDKCPIEWFHYGCVGLEQAPTGKWFCPQCTQTMKRRNKNK
uniref:inhibitor of growth protein 3 isoform X1 n=1 Tax=Ciona intestinalis TaxID=7719 RepID=UPI00089DD36F|nr:inhibitor of growth protein 3 isoform X1 [Ciona intestinalis]|eukprot:XP_018670605.1 inhibitor of growth protein 3 isoform X1 [Ciona intestinalis]